MKAILVAALLIAPLAAQAQQYVRTTPASTTTTDASGTISATNTFQKVLSSNVTRSGCTIQNNGSHNMFVTENRGLSGSSLTNSTILAPGGIYHCEVGGMVLTGEIDITGTAADAFYATQY